MDCDFFPKADKLVSIIPQVIKSTNNHVLVGGWALPLWKMMEFVSWDDDYSQY